MGRKRYVVCAGKSGGNLTSREMGPVSEAVWPQGGTWLPLPRKCVTSKARVCCPSREEVLLLGPGQGFPPAWDSVARGS